MEREGVVQEMIFRALRCLNDEFPEDKKVPINADTMLFGGQSLLDSLSLVSVIVDVEGAIADEIGQSVALTDDRAMNQEVSPFTDVRALTAYIVMLLNESAA